MVRLEKLLSKCVEMFNKEQIVRETPFEERSIAERKTTLRDLPLLHEFKQLDSMGKWNPPFAPRQCQFFKICHGVKDNVLQVWKETSKKSIKTYSLNNGVLDCGEAGRSLYDGLNWEPDPDAPEPRIRDDNVVSRACGGE